MPQEVLQNRYRLVEEVGRGTMGTVYRVEDLTDGGTLALKLLTGAREQPGALSHFEQEFLSLTQLMHPNLVAVHDFGTAEREADGASDRLPFFTMDFVEGKTLDAFFAENPDFEALYRLLADVAGALAYLHSRGLIHLDVKSSNVLVTPADNGARPIARLVDFGLIDTARTMDGSMIHGTVGYMAPELARGGRVDPRADLYSLGVVMYELATGKLPFRGASPLEIIRGHLEEDPLPARTLNTKVSEGLSEIIDRCLRKEPAARFASAGELVEALSRLAGENLGPESAEVGRSYVLSGRYVGRDREVEQLREAVEEAGRERGRLVLVGGEAGSGKTRLLRELRVWCQLRDIPFFIGRCHDDHVVPYGPVVEVLDAALRHWGGDLDEALGRHGPALAALLPRLSTHPAVESSPRPAPLGPEEERLRMIGALSDFLRATPGEGPVVITIEDLNHADEATCDLLRMIGRDLARQGGRLLITGTYRDEDLSRTSPLFALLSEGREESTVTEIALRGLKAEETESLVRSMLGTEGGPPALAQRVHEETRGNPFFIEELMTLLVDEGVVTPGKHALPAAEALEVLDVPRRTRDTLERRLARLDESERELLRGVAVAGGVEVTPDALSDVLEAEPAKVRAGLASLVRADLLHREVDSEGGVRYRAAHNPVAQVARETAPAERLAELHRRTAERLEREAGESGDDGAEARSGLLAQHFLRAGLPDRALPPLVRAADHAAALHANREALDLYGIAIELIARGQAKGDRAPLCELYEKRGNLREMLGEMDFAEEDYQWMAARAEKDANDFFRARARVNIGNVFAHRSNYEGALEEYGKALELQKRLGAQNDVAEALRLIGRLHARLSEYPEAHDHLDRCLEIARRTGQQERVVRALTDKGLTHRERGEYREALECLTEAHRAVESSADRGTLAAVLQGLALCHDDRGQIADAVSRYEESLAISREIGDIQMVASTATHLGSLKCRMGETEPGMRLLDESLEISRRIGAREAALPTLQTIAGLHLSQGHYSTALEVAEEALRTARRAARRDDVAIALDTIGRIYLRVGDHGSAGRCLEEAHDLLREARSQRLLATVLTDLAELRLAIDEPEPARERFNEVCFIARKVGDTRRESAGMTGLADSYLRAKDFDRAATACRKAVELLEGSRMRKPLADALLLRARLETERPGGDMVAAADDLRQALSLSEGMQDAEVTWQVQHLLGRVLSRLGDRELSEEAFRAAFLHLDGLYGRLPEKWRRTWYRDPLRAAFSREWERLKIRPTEEAVKPAEGRLAAHEKLKSDFENLTRFLAINKKLNSTLQLSVLLRLIIDTAIELTGAERGFLILSRPDGMAFEVSRTSDGNEVPAPERDVSRSIAKQVMQQGVALVSTDAREDPRFSASKSVHALKLRSVAAIPLRLKEEIAGALYLDSRLTRGVFGEEHARLLTLFADQAAIAMENARLWEELEARQAEIERLNRELERTVVEQREQIGKQREEIAEKQSSLELRYRYDNLIGMSRPMQSVYSVLDKIVDSRIPVLITGESGTGKELIARAVHYNGPRKKERSLTVNCAAFTETLLSSELFGYKRGAFTGADKDHKGIFEMADKGTLVLDEIGDMPVTMQAKLLRVLQEGEVLPLGGREIVKIDVRIIAITNQPLRERIAEGRFREDLYFRLNVANIHMPPLRDRKEDITILVDHFLGKIADSEGKPRKRLDGPSLKLLSNHDWPGNVRELEHEIVKLVTFTTGELIGEKDVRENSSLFEPRPGPRPGGTSQGPASAEAGKPATLREIEKREILKALDDADGNRSKAARILGINRATLFRKMKRYDLQQ